MAKSLDQRRASNKSMDVLNNDYMPFTPELNKRSILLAKQSQRLSKLTLPISTMKTEAASELPIYKHKRQSIPNTPSLKVNIINGKVQINRKFLR